MNSVPSELINEKHIEIEKNAKFRGNNCFLTYAQSGTGTPATKQDFVNKWSTTCQWGIVCQENHKDEGVHLHGIIHKDDSFNLVIASAFKINGHQPNVGKVNSMVRALKYIQKEDKEPLKWGNVPEFDENNKLIKKKITAQDAEAFKDWNSFYSANNSQMSCQSVHSYQRSFTIIKNSIIINYPKPEYVDWKFQSKRFMLQWKEKLRHYWVKSDPNCGKTWFAQNILIKEHKGFAFEFDNNGFVHNWIAQARIAIIDDKNEISWNKIKDATNAIKGTPLNCKGGSIINEKKKIIFVFSNKFPKESLQGNMTETDWRAFEERFAILEITKKWSSQEIVKPLIISLDD